MSVVDEKRTVELYKKYQKKGDIAEKYSFGDSILYKMCIDNPKHDDPDVIIGKIMIIGRVYSAAIERRKNTNEFKGDFYIEKVAPAVKKIAKKLDEQIASFKKRKCQIKDCIPDILRTHKLLTNTFESITELEKRSLASKYLHFHCPDKFYLYDSRASQALKKLVHKPDKSILADLKNNEYDVEYADFVCRMVELQECLEKNTCEVITPRKIDSFLLYSGIIDK